MAKSERKAKRNLNGVGTFDYIKTKKLWRGRVLLDGVRHQLYGKTRAIVHQRIKGLPEELRLKTEAARQAEEEAKEKARRAKEETTVADYLTHWLTEVKLEHRPNTYENYEIMVRKHLIPRIGDRNLNELTSNDISATWLDMLEDGYSASVIEHCHARLTTAYNVAIDKGTLGVTINPTLKAKKPSVEKEEVNPLDPDNVELLLDAVEGTDYFSVIHTALNTGMRRNELLALRWSDIDLGAGTISVHRQIYRAKGATSYHPLKTKNSRRFISLPPESVQHLNKEWERQVDMGHKASGNSPVFIRPTGEQILPNGLTHAFTRIVTQIAERQAAKLTEETKITVDAEDIGISKNHFHDLRHTHASRLYAQGWPDVVISKRLGHATVAITMEIYVHIRPTMEKDYIQNYTTHPTKTWV